MTSFRPYPGMLLPIRQVPYAWTAHPMSPSEAQEVMLLEGSTAWIYQLQNLLNQRFYALKVFKPAFRQKRVAHVTEYLTEHADHLALPLDERLCLTRQVAPNLLTAFPDLEFALLTPWNAAPTWADLLADARASAGYTWETALSLALATATTLWNLEALGVAHANLSGRVLVPMRDWKRVELLDFEKMYLLGLPPPKRPDQGAPGYLHRHLGPEGQCCAVGDRFAGALLLTEILTWWQPTVRAVAAEHSSTLFPPEDVQKNDTQALPAVRNTLRTLHPDLLALFDQAWHSRTLAECPAFHDWSLVLLSYFASPDGLTKEKGT